MILFCVKKYQVSVFSSEISRWTRILRSFGDISGFSPNNEVDVKIVLGGNFRHFFQLVVRSEIILYFGVFSKMPRNFVRKTVKPNEDAMAKAIEAVGAGSSVRKAAKTYGVQHETLRGRLKGKHSNPVIAASSKLVSVYRVVLFSGLFYIDSILYLLLRFSMHSKRLRSEIIWLNHRSCSMVCRYRKSNRLHSSLQ